MPDTQKNLILGGARSGKSAYAEAQALAMPGAGRWLYVATADAGDAEMRARIRHHRASRDTRWETMEVQTGLADVLAKHDDPAIAILVDCLTLWLSNCLARECWQEERDKLLEAAGRTRAGLYLVSNEVGSGVVPLGAMSRRFVDESGRLHQRLAEQCHRVTLVVAGLPLPLKPASKINIPP